MEMTDDQKKEGFSFTDEQLEVIRAGGCDLLVSAAAGSGKTAVLAERIVRRIAEDDPPCDIDRILVVTFTRAAASGMREKIAGALAKRIAAQPDNRHLRRQEMLLPHAKIMTIDAFCQYLLRNNFSAIGLDPSFRVSDEGEMKLLEQEVLAQVLEDAYAEGTPEFLRCMDCLSGGAGDEPAETEIMKLYRYAKSMPWPMRSLKELLNTLTADEELFTPGSKTPAWVTGVTVRIREELRDCIRELEKLLRIAGMPGGPYMYADTITDDIESLTALAALESFPEMYDHLLDHELFGKLSAKRDDAVDRIKRDRVKNLRNGIKDAVGKNIKRYFNTPPREFAAREKKAAEMTRELVLLTMEFITRLDEKKREKNLIDFSDMEHLALQVLLDEPEEGKSISEAQPTKTALAYAEFYREIMVDEYQDSNMIQELILDAVSARRLGRPDRFMVGDIKQSIYRFRLARPEIFAEKMHRFGGEDPSERRIDLHRNFRSRPEILDAVNAVHERIMAANIGGVDYDEDAHLVPGIPCPEDEDGEFIPELLLISRDGQAAEKTSDRAEQADADTGTDSAEPDDNDTEAGDPEEMSGVLTGAEKAAEELEAGVVADRILQLMEKGRVRDGDSGMRPVRYGDIVILLRTASGVDEIYRDVLTARGIPVHMESKAGYFGTIEIRLLIDLLHAIENPFRDIPLAAVMHSFIGGFSDEELAEIRTADLRDGHGFYEALTARSKNDGQDPLSVKCRAFLKELEDFRDRSMRMSVHDLLEEILAQTRYLEIVSAMPGGRRRQANVRMLLIRAAAFAASGGHGLAAFTQRLEQYRLAEIDLGEASTLSEDADLVRLMSIHKSKGLEFPIVFVSGLARQFNRMDENGTVLVDEHAGIGAKCVDSETRVSVSTLKRLAVADRIREESLGEEIRVLYVAMTRAKDRLIMTGLLAQNKAEALLEEIARINAQGSGQRDQTAVSYRSRYRAQSFLDLLTAAMREGGVPIRAELAVLREAADECTGGSAVIPPAMSSKTGRKEALTSVVNTSNNKCYQNAELREKLAFSYTHSDLERLFVKTTVTELKERILAEESEGPGRNELYRSIPEPPTASEDRNTTRQLTGAERGTAYHKVMELLDAEILDQIDVSNHDLISESCDNIRNIVKKWMIKQEQKKRLQEGASETVRPDDVLKFLADPLGIRFAEAYRRGELCREKQFMMGMDAADVQKGLPAGEMVLIQGVIDVYFTEGESIILLDYKTDRITGDASELAEKYGVQLALYADALERVTGRKVTERWIWSFTAGRAVPVREN